MALFQLSAPPFNWCWLKLARAREHMETIKNEIVAWDKTKSDCFVKECNAEMTRYSVVVRFTNPPPLEHLALVAADCFHNLRAALDQFIYAVAIYQSGQDPPPDFNRLMFPICDTADNFRTQQWRIKSLGDPVRAVIERVQPYNRWHPHVPPFLALLRDFNDTDKHRLLQVTMLQFAHGGFSNISGLAPGQPVQMFVRTDGVDDGAEIAALVLDRPTPNVRYEVFRVTMHVAIRHAAGPRGQDRTALQGIIGDIVAEIERVMLEIYKVL